VDLARQLLTADLPTISRLSLCDLFATHFPNHPAILSQTIKTQIRLSSLPVETLSPSQLRVCHVSQMPIRVSGMVWRVYPQNQSIQSRGHVCPICHLATVLFLDEHLDRSCPRCGATLQPADFGQVAVQLREFVLIDQVFDHDHQRGMCHSVAVTIEDDAFLGGSDIAPGNSFKSINRARPDR
jgi:DNA replicative helicase MCM subunit Mcm2 (Cdc46/Mcm family)